MTRAWSLQTPVQGHASFIMKTRDFLPSLPVISQRQLVKSAAGGYLGVSPCLPIIICQGLSQSHVSQLLTSVCICCLYPMPTRHRESHQPRPHTNFIPSRFLRERLGLHTVPCAQGDRQEVHYDPKALTVHRHLSGKGSPFLS